MDEQVKLMGLLAANVIIEINEFHSVIKSKRWLSGHEDSTWMPVD
jgi:hypothetical protein